MYFIAIAILSHEPSRAGCISCSYWSIGWLIDWLLYCGLIFMLSHILITVMYMCMQLIRVLWMHLLRLALQCPIYSTTCRLLLCYPLVGGAMNFDLTCTRLKVSTSCRTNFYWSPKLRSSASNLPTKGILCKTLQHKSLCLVTARRSWHRFIAINVRHKKLPYSKSTGSSRCWISAQLWKFGASSSHPKTLSLKRSSDSVHLYPYVTDLQL